MDEEKITQAQETGESVPQGEETAPQTGEQPQEQSAQEAPAATEDEWRAALEQAVKDRDAYLAMAQRAQADFQNFKRRNQQVRADAYDDGVREALTALLQAQELEQLWLWEAVLRWMRPRRFRFWQRTHRQSIMQRSVFIIRSRCRAIRLQQSRPHPVRDRK